MEKTVDASDFIATNAEKFNAFAVAILEMGRARQENVLVVGLGALACSLSSFRSAALTGALKKDEAFALFITSMMSIAVDLDFITEADADAFFQQPKEQP